MSLLNEFTMKRMFLTIVMFNFLIATGANCQTINYYNNSSTLPVRAENILKEMMKVSGVLQATVTETNKTSEQKVDKILRDVIKYGFTKAYEMYEAEGDSVIYVLELGFYQVLDMDFIKYRMLTVLNRFLPQAQNNNRMLHVNRGDKLIAFDVSLPGNKNLAFESVAYEFKNNRKLSLFLGSWGCEKGTYHIEILTEEPGTDKYQN